MSLEFPGIISLQIQVTTKAFKSWIHYWTLKLGSHSPGTICSLSFSPTVDVHWWKKGIICQNVGTVCLASTFQCRFGSIARQLGRGEAEHDVAHQPAEWRAEEPGGGEPWVRHRGSAPCDGGRPQSLGRPHHIQEICELPHWERRPHYIYS